jgi:hypothetical protein
MALIGCVREFASRVNKDTGGEFVVERVGRFGDGGSMPLAIGSLPSYQAISREGAYLMSLQPQASL